MFTEGARKLIVYGFTGVAIVGAMIGVYNALHSSLFLVQVVEVADQPENAPLDAGSITQLAAIPTGMVNLFDLDLKAVEQRVLANPWVREVRLQKRFPQTLSVAVVFREPQALIQSPGGSLSYVDSNGMVFGQVNLAYQPDLPIFSGLEGAQIQPALKLLSDWDRSSLRSLAQISSLHWDQEKGFRALITYKMMAKGGAPVSRTSVELGQDLDGAIEAQFRRLSEVLKYLSTHSIPAKQIWADAGKKIVVKTARGS